LVEPGRPPNKENCTQCPQKNPARSRRLDSLEKQRWVGLFQQHETLRLNIPVRLDAVEVYTACQARSHPLSPMRARREILVDKCMNEVAEGIVDIDLHVTGLGQ